MSSSGPISNRLFFLVAAALLAGGGFFAYAGVERFFTHWDWLNDLWYFFDAAELFNYGQFDVLYNPDIRVALGHGATEGEEVFPYPATLALLYLPLTEFDLEVTARLIFLGISIGVLLLIVVMGYFWSRDWRFAVLMLIGGATLFPLYETLRFSQLSPFIACLYAAAVVNFHRNRWVSGAVFVGLLAFKPTFAIAPFALLLKSLHYRAIVLAAAIGATIGLVMPVTLVGVEGVQHYVEQLARYRDEAFKLDGIFTAGAAWMLNWNGFIGRLFGVDPSAWVIVPLYVMSLLLAVKVWMRGEITSSYLAGLLATLLVVPHLVWYDWAILFGVAPFAVYQARSPWLLGLVLALHFSASLDSHFVVTHIAYDTYFNSSTLFATATLAYLAFAPMRATAPAIEATGEATAVIEPVEEPIAEPVAREPAPVPAGAAAGVPEPAAEAAGSG